MAKIPAFSALVQNFPYKPKDLTPARTGPIPAGATVATNKSLVTAIGGKLNDALSAIYTDLDRMNTCAIRLSYCLNRCKQPLNQSANVRTYLGADKQRYIISADEMITYLNATYGKGTLVFNGQAQAAKRWTGTAKAPLKGIFGYDWQGRVADFGASGHVDIGRMDSDDPSGITEYGTGAYFLEGPMKVYFWPSA